MFTPPTGRVPMDTDTVAALIMLGIATALFGAYSVAILIFETPELINF